MRHRASVWLFSALAAAGVLLIATHFAQLTQFVDMAEKSDPRWLILAIGFQATTYVCLAVGWNAVLDRAGHRQKLRRLVPIALIKLFADQALPDAGLGGNVVLVQRLMDLGAPRATAMAALLVSMIGFYAAYGTLALAMLGMLWLHREVTPPLVGVVTMLLMVAIGIPSLALWLRQRGSHPLPPNVEGIGPIRQLLTIIGEAPARLVHDHRLILRVSLWNGLIFVADTGTLAACLCALGQPLHPSTAFIGLMSGSIAATLVPIPLGLGSFEASCIAMLTLLGVRIEPAMTATLLLRGMTLWVPLLLGLTLMRRRHHPRGLRSN